MFLVDDILLSPIKFPLFVFKKIHEAAENEFTDKDKITSQLRELYLLVEAGRISEEEFNQREAELLDQLEAIDEYEKGKNEEALEEPEGEEDARDG
ncbi:MAG: gas vesicle protein GvpG [Candidatus Brocadiaceae bacterium]|nr:gas vesicle protein GvpG [Candidatus Brocadiaceae bacterium]